MPPQTMRQFLKPPEKAPDTLPRTQSTMSLLDYFSTVIQGLADPTGWTEPKAEDFDNPHAYTQALKAHGVGQLLGMAAPLAAPLMLKLKGVRQGTSTIAEYQGIHAPPMADSGAPLHDLTGGGRIYPDDVYSPKAAQYYGPGGDRNDVALFRQIHALKDKPDAPVKVWRAVPKNAPVSEIQHGDWVTISKKYAQEHGEGPLRGDYKLIEAEVPAKTLFTNGDSPYEFGLDLSVLPPEAPQTLKAFHGSPSKSDVQMLLAGQLDKIGGLAKADAQNWAISFSDTARDRLLDSFQPHLPALHADLQREYGPTVKVYRAQYSADTSSGIRSYSLTREGAEEFLGPSHRLGKPSDVVHELTVPVESIRAIGSPYSGEVLIDNTDLVKSTLKAFHGSPHDFVAYDMKQAGATTDAGKMGKAAYFSTDPNVSAAFPHQYEAELSIENPLKVSMAKWGDDKSAIVKKALGLPETATPVEMTDAARAKGHDSVVLDYSGLGYKHQEIAVFESKQIVHLAKKYGISLPAAASLYKWQHSQQQKGVE